MNLPHKNVADCFAIPSKKLIFVPEFQYNSNTEQHIVLVNKKNKKDKYDKVQILKRKI